ncbi:MAG: sensor histidine kinase [Armatimonadota bacterium]
MHRPTLVIVLVAVVIIVGVLHELFMMLPTLQYHLIVAILNAAALAFAVILYLKWRGAAVIAESALHRLRASEALRDDLTAMLVHDLKNPLITSLMASKSLLTRFGDLTEQQRARLEMAVESQERLISMIEDLLDVARAEEGELPLTLAENDLAPIIESVVAEAALPAQRAAIHLSSKLEACPAVLSDADKVRRVVANLVANATKFTPEGGEVVVSLRCREGEAQVTVRDTGQGLPPGSHEAVFDKFMQASTDAPRLSVGLGLTFCKLAIEAQGGRIWAESRPGEGSTFVFSLPLARSAPQ